MIGKIDNNDRELLINVFDNDQKKWEDFLQTIQDKNFVFYKPYKKI